MPDQARPAWVEFLSSKAFVFLLPLLWALAYLPQLQARDLRLEEGRRAQPAAEMVATGDWITPRIYGEAYLNKPPLFFWMASGLGKIQGRVSELSVRIPSVISVLLGAYLILVFARRQLRLHVRALAALIFMSMPIMLDKGTLGEIDAFLSLVTFASLAALWNYYDAATGKIALRGWVLAGLAMAVGALAKGPGGPLEFYVIFVPFLLLTRRWKLLFSPGHFLMILLALIPVAGWVFLLVTGSAMHADSVAYQWLDQLGLRSLLHTPTAFAGQKESAAIPWRHYERFPLDVISMLLPWSVVAIFAAFPGVVRKAGWLEKAGGQAEVGEDSREASSAFRVAAPQLFILLAISAPALTAVFWAYPMAFARHMMMVAYPVSVLVAVMVCTPRATPAWLRPLLQAAAVILAIALAVMSVGAVAAGFVFARGSLGLTVVVAAGALAGAAWAYRLGRRTAVGDAAIAAAAGLAVLMILGRGVVASVLLPAKAPSDVTRMWHEQMDAKVPRGLPIFTTRTLLSGNGNNYFNVQFYLPRVPKAIDDFGELPPGETVVVIVAGEEWQRLARLFPDAELLGSLAAKNWPPPLYVVRLKVPTVGGTASRPGGRR